MLAERPTAAPLPTAPAITVDLRRLFPRASFVGSSQIRVSAVTCRSQDVQRGMLFAALPGARCDGHQYISDAVQRGAAAVLVQRPQAGVSVPQCVVPDVRRAFGEVCAALYQYPAQRLKSVGITGTNGKTTTTWLVRALLQSAGLQTGLLGTIDYHDGLRGERSALTTPDASVLTHWLGRMVQNRTTHVAMEVSSHGLDQQRLAGTPLDVAILTNITQDHFDYHGDFERYRNTKRRIWSALKPDGLAVVNLDDPGSASCLAGLTHSRVVTISCEQPADIRAEILNQSLQGTVFRLRLPNGTIDAMTPLIGRHNVSNCLAAAAAGWHLGLTPSQIAHGLASFHAVPGRLEAIECGQSFSVFVDYAHTDDALRRCLAGLRELTPGRLLCLYGAGGDRDRGKRPLLTAAAQLADVPVLTSDNPRSEDPLQILADCLAGAHPDRPRPQVIPDRREAIASILSAAEPGDCVLLAGKGHETEQIIGTRREHFDDREEARRALTRCPRLESVAKPHFGLVIPELQSLLLPASPARGSS